MRRTAPDREAMLRDGVQGLILRLCAPCVLSTVALSLGALLDALLLAGSGAQAAAAVSLSFPLLTLLQAVGFTLGTGAGNFVSRSLGRGEEGPARQAAACALGASLLVPAALMAAGLPFARPLLRALGAPPEALAAGVAYARFVLCAGPLQCAGLVLSSLLRGEGRTWPSFFAYAGGAALGGALCALLAVRLRMGVFGAGIAMLAREALSLLVLAVCALRGGLRPSFKRSMPRLALWREIMRSGLPTLLRQGLTSLSGALLNRQCAAFGADALAGMGLAVRALSVVSSAVIGFGQGFQPVCGFAWGAGDTERVRRAYRFCQTAAFAALACAGVALWHAAAPLLALFGAPAGAARFGARVLRAQSPALFAQGAVILANMLAQSTGQTVRASLIATSRQGYLFIPLALTLPRLFGETGLALCQTASDLLALPLCLLLARGAAQPEDKPRAAAANPSHSPCASRENPVQ